MSKKIEKIVIIGAGNVATHLAIHLSKVVTIVGILSKNNSSAVALAKKINTQSFEQLNEIPENDLILICTNDSTISIIESEIPSHFNIAYTSGSTSLESLSNRKYSGVFYPLQTFSKEKEITLSDVPFFIEASNDLFGKSLFDLALTLSSNVSFANSLERKKLHLSAIFVNNFINHLAHIANQYTEKEKLNWDHLKPLIRETIDKLNSTSPKEAQTGPARRNDLPIIQEHLSMLDGFPKKIYELLSESIIDTYSTNDNK